MKRLIMIFVLALWLPLGVGFATPEEYDGSQDPEAWFFDSILDENGNLFLDSYQKYSVYEFHRAIADMNEQRFGCIRTETQASVIRPPSYQLSAHLHSLITVPPLGNYELQESRYLIFAGCMYRYCPAQSHYFIDTVGKHIAIVTIDPTSFFNTEKDVYGDPVYDFDNFIKPCFYCLMLLKNLSKNH